MDGAGADARAAGYLIERDAKESWRKLIAWFRGIRVAAEDILVDGDKVAIRSSLTGTGDPGRRMVPDVV